MRWSAELSDEAEKQLARLPRTVRYRIERAIDELEEKDDSQWSNIKALQVPEWKGRFRNRVGAYRIIFRKFPDRGFVEISAILIKSKDPIGNKTESDLHRFLVLSAGRHACLGRGRKAA